ncbi:MAG: hypothetical protein KDB50_15655 [Mycobacterium sp.]|nr:hypothetical protein [Mycobacterium sp.]
MRDDPDAAAGRGRRRARQWPRAVLTGTGLLVTALATTYVIKTGASASQLVAVDDRSTPRTVIATVATETPVAAENAGAPESGSAPAQAVAALERPVPVPAPVAVAQPQVDLRQVIYTVAGNQRPDDPVTVIYADETGTLQTLDDVTLPWTLTMTPALPVNYVYAKSRGSQLNCWITDAVGATVASRTDYSPTTSCNR